jgi:hypothetical protein
VTTNTVQTPLSEVPLTSSARQQLRKARTVIAAWTGAVAVVFVVAIVAALISVKHVHWAPAIAPIVIIVGLLAFGVFRISQLSSDLKAASMTRFTGTFRERLSRPMRNSTFLRVKLPGSFMLLRSSARPMVSAAVEAGSEPRWTGTIGHVDYATKSRLLVDIGRDPV